MAQLVATPKSLVETFEFRQGEDFDAYLTRSDAAFKNLEAAADALPYGEVVGALITFPWADGHAIYRVVRAKPLKLQHIPYGDAWHVDPATIRGLRLEDVLRKVASAKGLKAMFASRASK